VGLHVLVAHTQCQALIQNAGCNEHKHTCVSIFSNRVVVDDSIDEVMLLC